MLPALWQIDVWGLDGAFALTKHTAGDIFGWRVGERSAPVSRKPHQTALRRAAFYVTTYFGKIIDTPHTVGVVARSFRTDNHQVFFGHRPLHHFRYLTQRILICQTDARSPFRAGPTTATRCTPGCRLRAAHVSVSFMILQTPSPRGAGPTQALQAGCRCDEDHVTSGLFSTAKMCWPITVILWNYPWR